MDRTYNLFGAAKPTTKRAADLDGPDFSPTPSWATFALIENEPFRGDIWECACGDGAMTEVLKETGNVIASTDLYDRGYGEIGHDFLTTTRRFRNIITNPPYHSAEGFVASALENAESKFALLLRLAFLEGANRARTIFHQHPPAVSGCSANGSLSIRKVPNALVAAQPLMRGSFGIRIIPGRRNLLGLNQALRPHIANEDTQPLI